MEVDNVLFRRVHHGRNIKRFRKAKGMKQELMADLINLSQQTVSRYESMRVIDDEILERFANALEISVDDLKNMDEDGEMNIFIENNNKFENNEGINFSASGVEQRSGNTNSQVFNPLDKVVELYERLIKEKEDTIESLKRRVQELENKS